VPGGDRFGCYDSDAWLVAVADGVISRSEFGAVELDLDGDGDSSTGWVILYQHVATRNRIPVGQRVRTGDRIGHPSCEGGYSTGTHLHIARLYNGRWISADREPRFNLGGWSVHGVNSEYNGLLVRAGEVRQAFAGRTGNNMITAGE
jgi:murein DD-endopeptidase MepM/ murein hydrolase activator NlpD